MQIFGQKSSCLSNRVFLSDRDWIRISPEIRLSEISQDFGFRAKSALLTPRRPSWPSTLRGPETSVVPALRGGGWVRVIVAPPLVPAPAGVLVPELRTARENARLEIGPQRGRNSHQIDVLGVYGLQGLSYGHTELLVAGMRLLAPDPSGTPRGCGGQVPVNGHIRTASA